MAGNNPESGHVRDIDEARIFADAEKKDRERAHILRTIARGHDNHGSPAYAEALRSRAEIYDDSAAGRGIQSQRAFEDMVSARLERWTDAVLTLHEPNDAVQLHMPTGGDEASVANNTALRRLADIFRLGKPEPIRLSLPLSENTNIFVAQTRRPSSALEVEILQGVLRPADLRRSRKNDAPALFARRIPPTPQRSVRR